MAGSVYEWAADWSDNFNQSLTEDEIRKLVGQRITLARPDSEEGKPRGIKKPVTIVGYSQTTLFCFDEIGNLTTDDPVFMWQLLTSEGNGLPLFADMTVTVVEEEEVPL